MGFADQGYVGAVVEGGSGKVYATTAAMLADVGTGIAIGETALVEADGLYYFVGDDSQVYPITDALQSVASYADLPATALDGTLALDESTLAVYRYSTASASWEWIANEYPRRASLAWRKDARYIRDEDTLEGIAAGAIDIIDGSGRGTPINNVSPFTWNAVDSVAEADGVDDYVIAENTFDFVHDGSPFHIAARLKFNADPTVTSMTIFQNAGAGGPGFFLNTNTGSGDDLRFAVKNSSNVVVFELTHTTWSGFDLAATYDIEVHSDGTTAVMKINGVAVDTKTFVDGGVGAAFDQLYIGRAQNAAANFLNADLESFWISEQVEDSSRLRAWMTSGPAGVGLATADLVEYEDTSGLPAADEGDLALDSAEAILYQYRSGTWQRLPAVVDAWSDRPRSTANEGETLRIGSTLYRYSSAIGDYVRAAYYTATLTLEGVLDGDQLPAAQGWTETVSGAGSITTDGTRVTMETGTTVADNAWIERASGGLDLFFQGYISVDVKSKTDAPPPISIRNGARLVNFTVEDVGDVQTFNEIGSGFPAIPELAKDDAQDVNFDAEHWVEIFVDSNGMATYYVDHNPAPALAVDYVFLPALASSLYIVGDFSGVWAGTMKLREVAVGRLT